MSIEDVLKEIASSSMELLKEQFGDSVEQYEQKLKDFIQSSEEKAKEWGIALLAGEIDKDELLNLVDGQKEILVFTLIQIAGLEQIKAEKTAQGLIGIIIENLDKLVKK